MRHSLSPHQDFPSSAVSGISVEIVRGHDDVLRLSYAGSGDPRRLLPSFLQPQERRADELWLATCCEAFVRPAGGQAYWEFNIAPDGGWQVYALDGYRSGRRPELRLPAPRWQSHTTPDHWTLRADWLVGGIIPDDVPWQVGLSAVTKDTDGAIGYWALRHAPDRPDFHHDEAFALELQGTP